MAHQQLQTLTEHLIQGKHSQNDKMKAIFSFVRDEIPFGWLYPQSVPPERILEVGRGVCMQKANLLVSMTRQAGIDARFHFMYVHKTALRDLLPDFAYNNWQDPFVHSFPEVLLNGSWVSMEATFDSRLDALCRRRKINFARNQDTAARICIDFSPDGVVGHQQYAQTCDLPSFYGEDLGEFIKYLKKDIPWYKQRLQPFIFTKAQKILDQLRREDATADMAS